MAHDKPGGRTGCTPKKRTRRRFIRSTGAAGVAGLLAGCSGNGDEGDTSDESGQSTGSTDGSVEVVFNNSLEGEVWEQYKQALYDSGLPDHIELTTTPLPGEGRNQTWEQWLSSGRKKPDLFMVDPTGRPFIQREYLANLSSLMDEEQANIVWEEMPEQMVSMYTSNGDLYAVPFLLDIALVQYRKDLIEEAGYDPSDWQTNPLTWERFSQIMADTASQADVDYGYGWPTTKNMLSNATFFEFAKSWGGAYFGDSPVDENVGERSVTIDEEPIVNALKMARSLIYGGDEDEHGLSGYESCSPEAVLQWADDPPVKHMEGGDMIGMRNWTWSIATLGAEDSYGEDLGVMPLPYGVEPSEAKYENAGGSNTVMSGWYVAVNANSENPEAAAKVLDAMVTNRSQITLFKQMGYAPTKPALYDSEAIQNMPVIGRYADALGYAANHTGGMPELNPHWDREAGFFDEALMRSLKQQEAPQEALSSAAERIADFEDSQA